MKVRLSLSERSHTIGSGDDDEDIYGVQRQACFFSLTAFLSMKEKDKGEGRGGGRDGKGSGVEGSGLSSGGYGRTVSRVHGWPVSSGMRWMR